MFGLLAGLLKITAVAAHETAKTADEVVAIGGGQGTIIGAMTSSIRGMTEAAVSGTEKLEGASFGINAPDFAALGRSIGGFSKSAPAEIVANASPEKAIAAPVKQHSIYECNMNDVVCPVTPSATSSGVSVLR